MGFLWNLELKIVSLPDRKKAKYLAEIQEWEWHSMHTLKQVQKLYGKLLHTCHVIPSRQAYLVNLESMLSIFNTSFFCSTPCSPWYFKWFTMVDHLALVRQCLQTHPQPPNPPGYQCLLWHQLIGGHWHCHWWKVEGLEAHPRMEARWQRYWLGRSCGLRTPGLNHCLGATHWGGQCYHVCWAGCLVY